jgi:hypothetical protein
VAGPGETFSSAAIEGFPETVEVWRIEGMAVEAGVVAVTTFVGRERERADFAKAVGRRVAKARTQSVHWAGAAVLARAARRPG